MNYKCVNCGTAAHALYIKYKTSLKLAECDYCKGIVDKYIEYDLGIVMINLVLMSKEAQRHILYNTEFKAFWKFLILMILLEAYAIWRDIPILSELDFWQSTVWTLEQEISKDNSNLLMWLTDISVLFLAICFGVISFLITLQLLMKLLSNYKSQVPLLRLLKGYSLASTSIIMRLPMLVWGPEGSPHTKVIHYLLVFTYTFGVFNNVLTVLYERRQHTSVLILIISIVAKYITCYYATLLLRELFS